VSRTFRKSVCRVRIRRWLYVVAVCLSSAPSACSSGSEGEAPASAEDLGSVALNLQTSEGGLLDAFDYTITGPGGFSRHATVDVQGSAAPSTLVAGLPSGSGYGVSLSAVARDNSFSCAGSASFSVLGRAVTSVTVKLQCREAPKTGGVLANGQINQCPLIDGISASPQSVLVGKQLALSAQTHDVDAAPSAPTYAWTATSGTFGNSTAAAPFFTCTTAGDVVVTLNLSDGDCGDTLGASVSCTASGNGGVAGGTGGAGGSNAVAGNAGSGGAAAGSVGSGGAAAGSVGSGGAAAGSAGSGGAVAGAGGRGGMSTLAWPGTADVVTVDVAGFFGANLSGLSYETATSAPAVLWAVQNSPSKLYRLGFDGASWVPDAGAWAKGKLLHYVDGTGSPDSEGITKPDSAGSAMYVATEHDDDNSAVSKLVILRVDTSSSSAELTATNQWNLTADLPAVGANLGLEAIAFVPDSALVAGGFIDEATHAAYDPARYANHAGGIFFVGIEENGNVYGYALDNVANTFVRVASFSSAQSGIMDLSYDRDSDTLWGYCDNTCGNKSTLFRLDAGAFQINRVYGPPATLPVTNNEGIAFAPSSECSAGQRAFFWSDDDQINGHALRRGSIPCGSF
jgi:hypothetical protein